MKCFPLYYCHWPACHKFESLLCQNVLLCSVSIGLKGDDWRKNIFCTVKVMFLNLKKVKLKINKTCQKQS